MGSRDGLNYTAVTTEQPLIMRRPKVSVCTSAHQVNVQSFIDELHVQCPEVISDVRYFPLPYNDIGSFSLSNKGIDVMILCHSINNRRFSITDVMDALYDTFLYNAKRTLGRSKICVLVHDFSYEKLNTGEKYRAAIQSFRSQQPTTFECASLVMMGGKLDQKAELGTSQWEELRAFMLDAGQSTHSTSTIPDCGDVCIIIPNVVNVGCQTVIKSPRRQLMLVAGVCLVGLIIVLVVVFHK